MSERTFTQEEFDRIVARDTRKQREEIAALEARVNSRTELIRAAAAHGVEIVDGDVVAAGNRVLEKLAADNAKFDSDAAARRAELAAQIEATLASIVTERDGLKGEITDRKIDYELTTAAQKSGAFDAAQVVTMLRPHTRVLPNGEIIVQDLMPSALQSVGEAVDFLSIDKPNLFTRNVTGRPT